MKKINSTVLILSLLCASLFGALAQDAAKNNTILLKATAAYEDMVGPALAKNDKTVAKFLAEADQESDGVKKALPAEAAKKFDTLLQSIHQSADAKDGLAVAKNAVVVFRLLVDSLKADLLKIPVEVSLLDWAGYQLQVLAAADQPDWDAMSKVAAEADTWWKATAKKVAGKNLRAAVTTTMHGLQQAAKERNLSMVKFGAQVDLDLVDLVEGAFKK